MKHVISVWVENRFGVLSHVSGLFSSRGFNIESLTVGETHDPTISRMTIVVDGDERVLEQVTKQLNKLIDVITVRDLTQENNYLERELILVRVNAENTNRPEIFQIASIFNARIVDVAPRSFTLEVVGDEEKINAFLNLIRSFGIKELVRTGKIAISRASKKEK